MGSGVARQRRARFRFRRSEISLRWYTELPTVLVPWRWLRRGADSSAAAVLVGTCGARYCSVGRQCRAGTYFRFLLQVPFVVTAWCFCNSTICCSTCRHQAARHFSGRRRPIFFSIPTRSVPSARALRDLERTENAARIAGATELGVLYRVTLPALKPGLFAGFFFSFIVSFGDVPVSVFLTSGGVVPLPVEIFQTLQFDFDPRVLAISTIIVVLSSGFIVTMQRGVGLDLVLPGSGGVR